MRLAIDIAVLALAWSGAVLVVLAAAGIVRMPDLYSRLQASSKAPSVAIACFALALVIFRGGPDLTMRAIALVLLMFVTAPVSAHLIARAGFVSRIEVEPGTRVGGDRPPS